MHAETDFLKEICSTLGCTDQEARELFNTPEICKVLSEGLNSLRVKKAEEKGAIKIGGTKFLPKKSKKK